LEPHSSILAGKLQDILKVHTEPCSSGAGFVLLNGKQLPKFAKCTIADLVVSPDFILDDQIP